MYIVLETWNWFENYDYLKILKVQLKTVIWFESHENGFKKENSDVKIVEIDLIIENLLELT